MKRKIKLVSIISVVVLVILLVVVWIINLNRSATLNILVTPLDATVFINGKKYVNGVYHFFPCEVSIKIEHNVLDTKEYKLELNPSTTTLLYDYLTKDGNFSYYIDHVNDYEVLKFVYDNEALGFINQQEMIGTVVDILPLKIIKYMPEYYVSIENASSDSRCTRVVCLRIVDNTANHFASTEALKGYGYNVGDYSVFYESE